MAEAQKAQTLAELSGDIFLLVLGFRRRADLIDYSTLHSGVLALFEAFDAQAKALRLDAEDVADCRYALAAFVDETVLRSRWAGNEQWADNPLQLQFFETYLAGEGFFEKLEHIRSRGESGAEVLEVYYLCLILGFEGKYGMEGTERLSALASSIHDELRRFRPSDPRGISPHWKVVDGPKREANRLPRWLTYSCAAVIVLCVLFYAVFFISVRSAAGDLRHGSESAVLIKAENTNRLILC